MLDVHEWPPSWLATGSSASSSFPRLRRLPGQLVLFQRTPKLQLPASSIALASSRRGAMACQPHLNGGWVAQHAQKKKTLFQHGAGPLHFPRTGSRRRVVSPP